MESAENVEICSICKAESPNPNYITDCFHHFHGECLYAWFKKSQTCPVCRNYCNLTKFLLHILSRQIDNINFWGIHLSNDKSQDLTEAALSGGNAVLLKNILAIDSFIDKNYILHESSLCGNLEFVNIMINSGADINSLNNYGQTSLYLACEKGNLEIVKTLLEIPTIIVGFRGHSTSSVLFFAAQSENIELLKLLLNKDSADINAIDYNSRVTPLQHAFSKENIDLIVILLAYGADPTLLNQSNQSILDIAISKNNLTLILKAYDICPGINIKVTPKSNAISSAIQLKSLKFLKNLLDSGISVKDFLSEKKETILIAACKTSSLEMVKYLLETYEETLTTIDATDSNGMTALHQACESGNWEIVDLLLSHGTDRNHKNISDGTTALITATKANSTNIVKNLIQNFCNLNLRDKSDKNALDYAIESGNIEIVEHLFARGIHISALKRALVKICSIGNLHLLDIFIKNGILDKYDFGMELFHKSADFEVILKLSEVEISKRTRKDNNEPILSETASSDFNESNQIEEDFVNISSSA